MQSSPGSGANPTQGPSPGQGRMNYGSEGVNERPHYITDQNDRPEVDPMVINSSRHPEIPWINDDALSEESLQLDIEEIQPEQTESSARMKGELSTYFVIVYTYIGLTSYYSYNQ